MYFCVFSQPFHAARILSYRNALRTLLLAKRFLPSLFNGLHLRKSCSALRYRVIFNLVHFIKQRLVISGLYSAIASLDHLFISPCMYEWKGPLKNNPAIIQSLRSNGIFHWRLLRTLHVGLLDSLECFSRDSLVSVFH